MQEIATAAKDATSLHRGVPRDLFHPRLVRVDGDPGEVDLAALKMNEKQHVVRHPLRRALSEYVEHYHAERNHQGKSNVLLFRRVTETRRDEPVQCRERLGGLLRYYHQEAA